MSDPAKTLIPEGSVSIGGKEVEYSTLVALGFGILLGMIIKS